MPRGMYDRSKARPRRPATEAYVFENTVTLDGIDYLIFQAEADELAAAVVNECEPALRASILACILEARLNRRLMAPPDLKDLAERLHTFAPQLPPGHQPIPDNVIFTSQENPDAETGIERP